MTFRLKTSIEINSKTCIKLSLNDNVCTLNERGTVDWREIRLDKFDV
jgi:hypothetical protein